MPAAVEPRAALGGLGGADDDGQRLGDDGPEPASTPYRSGGGRDEQLEGDRDDPAWQQVDESLVTVGLQFWGVPDDPRVLAEQAERQSRVAVVVEVLVQQRISAQHDGRPTGSRIRTDHASVVAALHGTVGLVLGGPGPGRTRPLGGRHRTIGLDHPARPIGGAEGQVELVTRGAGVDEHEGRLAPASAWNSSSSNRPGIVTTTVV